MPSSKEKDEIHILGSLRRTSWPNVTQGLSRPRLILSTQRYYQNKEKWNRVKRGTESVMVVFNSEVGDLEVSSTENMTGVVNAEVGELKMW